MHDLIIYTTDITFEEPGQLVGIETGCGMDGRDSIPDKRKISVFLHSVQPASVAHLASNPMATGREADLHRVPGLRTVELYLHSPIRIQVVLN
jgi:hypothetical protein